MREREKEREKEIWRYGTHPPKDDSFGQSGYNRTG
jgi:hypothetical protein